MKQFLRKKTEWRPVQKTQKNLQEGEIYFLRNLIVSMSCGVARFTMKAN
jgi:hypothetical protein